MRIVTLITISAAINARFDDSDRPSIKNIKKGSGIIVLEYYYRFNSKAYSGIAKVIHFSFLAQ